MSAPGSALPEASSSAAPPEDPVAVATAFVKLLGDGKLTEASRRIVLPKGATIPESDLGRVWDESRGTRGAFRSIASATFEPHGKAKLVRVVAELEGGTLDVLVGVDDKGHVDRLRLLHAKARYATPPYVDATKITVSPAMIGEGALALPGTLVVPKGATKLPVAILIHGSGGGDRDESNDAGSRPFRDLAEGLASRGIAVLRWDKRSGDPVGLAALGKPLAELTVREEYFDDVGRAIETAKKIPGADPGAIVLVGHSMGAWLLPWLAKEHPEIARGVMLAGNARPMHTIVVPQLEHIARSNDGTIDPLEQAAIDDAKLQWKLAGDPSLPADTPASKLPFSQGALYWRSISSYDAVKTALAVETPLLILQGGRDYQVTEKDDFSLWKRALSKREHTRFGLYPDLNHAFVAGKGMATPDEYESSDGHVDPKVIEDLAAFILEPKP